MRQNGCGDRKELSGDERGRGTPAGPDWFRRREQEFSAKSRTLEQKMLFQLISTRRSKCFFFYPTKTKCGGSNFALTDAFNFHSEEVDVN